MARNRLPREVEEINRDEILKSQMKVETINNQLNNLKCSINGPPDTPYSGGNFVLTATFPDNYPFKPPKISFNTKIWHPNVSDDGHICLDILRSRWTPVTTLRGVLLSIQSLMQDPNPSSPLVSTFVPASFLYDSSHRFPSDYYNCIQLVQLI